MRRLLLVAVVMALVPACTHYYTKPGQSAAQFNRDQKECAQIGEQQAAIKHTRACDETENCLLAKGWRRN
jgi:hypothetical protein